MKFSALSPVILLSSVCAAQDLSPNPDLTARQATTCSIGIGRVGGTINWDATIYNVASALRQSGNVVGTATFVSMDKGQSMTVTGPPDVTIYNVDNTPAFSYDIPEVDPYGQTPLDSTTIGFTKVKLDFSSGSTNWTITDCSAGNVIFAAGRESWSCDFAC